MVNIFKEGKVMDVSPFYFKNIGDEVQGTYVGKRQGIDNYKNQVMIYELKNDSGISVVSFPIGKKINKDMEAVKFGQIIGFKYVSREKFIKNNKESEYKNMKVFADPNIVDQEWLNEHADGSNDSGISEGEESSSDSAEGTSAGFGDFDSPVPSETPAKSNLSNEEMLVKIAELAKTKLGAVESSQIKDKVMEATGLAFLPTNYGKILDVLNTL